MREEIRCNVTRMAQAWQACTRKKMQAHVMHGKMDYSQPPLSSCKERGEIEGRDSIGRYFPASPPVEGGRETEGGGQAAEGEGGQPEAERRAELPVG